MRTAVLVLLAGCLDISAEHHCMRDEDCVAGDLQGRCEPTTRCSFPDVDRCGEAYRYDDRAGARAGICVTRGPGTVPIDLATDATSTGCGAPGTRDAFVEILSMADQVLVADARAPVTMSLRDGPCPSAQPAEVMCQPSGCAAYGLLATAVEANRLYCLVVEEAARNEAAPFSLRILPAGRLGQPLAVPSGQASTTTCGQAVAPGSSCGAASPAAAFLLPLCGPGRLAATIDPADPLDAVVTLRDSLPSGPEIDCVNDGADVEMFDPPSLTGPGVYWMMVSSATAACGPFSLGYQVTPL